MKIENFSCEQLDKYFNKTRLLLLDDENIDDSTFRFAVYFQILWFIEGERPDGLSYSQREFSKKFKTSQKQVNRHLKRLETFGYITIAPFERRRMFYKPTEKLTGYKMTDINLKREDVQNITHYGKKNYSNDYAELLTLPKWPEIQEKVCDKLRLFKGCLSFQYSFKAYYTKHPIPLQNVYNIIETFSKVKNNAEFKRSPEAYLAVSFKNAEEAFKLGIQRKIEGNKEKNKAKEMSNIKNVALHIKALENLAYNLNTGKIVTDSDIPKTLLSLWEDTDRVTIDKTGYVKRFENVLFFTKPNDTNIYTTSIVNIGSLKRQGIVIPGLEDIEEAIQN